ncbi:MAG: hypothetical protein WCE62_11265 [Polyangiales bacterium]
MRLPFFLMVVFSLTLSSCIESVDIPVPPDMQPLLAAYPNPTADVGPDIMARWAQPILDTKETIEEASLPEQLLDLVEDLQTELASPTNEEGVVVVNGAPVSEPNGVIRINRVCAGWDDDAEARDPDVDGTIDLTLTLHGGRLDPVVWGIFHKCRWTRMVGNRSVEVEYDGEIRAHFGSRFGTDTRIRDRLITFAVTGNAAVGDTTFPIRQSFRLALAGALGILDAGLDILVETDEGEYFVFFFRAEDFAAGVHDVTGRYFCSLEERRCESLSGSFSW